MGLRVDPNRPVGDSAVALYWEPKELAPGAAATWVTYYGLAGVGGGNAWIDAPVNITSDEPGFSATLWVTNLSDADFTGGEARIVLPQGLRLAEGETERKPMASVPVNGGAQSVTWRLVGDGQADATYPYSATVTFQAGSGPLSADASVAYRYLAPPAPTVTTEPSPTATPTNTPVPPVVAPVVPAQTQPERTFPWWLLLLPLLLLPLLLLLFRRRSERPASARRAAPCGAVRAPARLHRATEGDRAAGLQRDARAQEAGCARSERESDAVERAILAGCRETAADSPFVSQSAATHTPNCSF